MYLRRKCYSSASNYGYMSPVERLYSFCREDLLMRLFSDDDDNNRGLGAAVGLGMGGLGIGGLYGYAKHKDTNSRKNLEALKAGLSESERAAWRVKSLGAGNDGIVGLLAGANTEEEQRKVLQDFAKNGGNLKDLQKLLKKNDASKLLVSAKAGKGMSLEDAIIKAQINNGNFANAWAGNFKAFDGKGGMSKKELETVNKSLDYIAADKLKQSQDKLNDLEKLMATYGGNDKIPKSVKDEYLKTVEEIRSTSDSLSMRKLGSNVDAYKGKIAAGEKEVKNTLLKRIQANKKLSAAVGIGGLAGLAGLGYVAGDRK